MFIPEYTVTSRIVNNLSQIEYSRAMIENTVLLQSWENQLKNQSAIDSIYALTLIEGLNYTQETIKKAVMGYNDLNHEKNDKLNKLVKTADLNQYSPNTEIDEKTLKTIQTNLTGNETRGSGNGGTVSAYRKTYAENKAPTEVILAEIVELFDWVNSLDAKDNHTLIVTGVFLGRLLAIKPYEQFNSSTALLASDLALKTNKYNFKGFISIAGGFASSISDFLKISNSLPFEDNDYTKWLEFFTESLSGQTATTQEKVKILARNTKLAKTSKSARLSTRQERIIEYLQDYGSLQNKDFPMLFPKKSEDTVLRELKSLVKKGLIQKLGSTKSSRYELVN